MFNVKKELLLNLKLCQIVIPSQAIDTLSLHFKQVEEWGVKLGLTHAVGNELLLKHTLDSLLALSYFESQNFGTIVDIGSGAGFPGLCLAACLPQCQFILVERKQKRLGFLAATRALMGLKNVTVINDLETLKQKQLTEPTAVTFRAVTALNNQIAGLFLQYGNTIVAYKGKKIEAENEAALLSKFKSQIIVLNPPFKEERCLLVVKP